MSKLGDKDFEKYLEDYNEDLLTELFLLQYEIDKLKNKRKYDLCFINHLKEDKKELQQKIDKAIEYIKSQQKIFEEYDIVVDNQLKNLLEILGDKE